MLMTRLAMRAPAGLDGPAPAEYYAAALDMAEYLDGQRGTLGIQLPQHHASLDGYLPSPLVLASAVAARTQRIPILCMALLLLHHEPVKLAEDMAVLDLVSKGRVSYVLGLGYRAEERAMFGVAPTGLGAQMEEAITILRAAWTGEEFTHPTRGPVRVRPLPHTPGGPVLSYGGHSPAAARRAARFGMALFAETGDPELERVYTEEAARCGVTPAGCVLTDPAMPTAVFVAEDVERGWAELGPYLLHDASAYAEWNAHRPNRSTITSLSGATSVEELRQAGGAYRVVTPLQAQEIIAGGVPLVLDPLCGGVPPELAWPYLRNAVAASGAARAARAARRAAGV
ncbi:LLM class flavin-dependent oxidoreductase [Rhodococcus sp. X156]|uniref:LLM class flavin-dependent oxidoreductase n=1 Tax=Rhodococcus sp. X156 TaxID=2499145 RepID=UPI0019D2289A|nr:LLM class flavin-dependent oxidoreductase [Rhodococcus sp. X156]